jgi:hypothetical protein
MLIIMVRTLRMSDLRSSDRCSAVLGSRSPSIGSLRVPASFATTAAAGWLSRGGRRVQTSPTQSISEGGAMEAPFCGRKPAGTAGPGLGACLRDGGAGRREQDDLAATLKKQGTEAGPFSPPPARAVGKVSKVSLAWFSEGVRASCRAAVPPCRRAAMSTRRCPVSPASTVTTLLAVSVLGVRFIFFPAPRLVAHAAPLVPVQPALQHIPATTGANASAAGQSARVARPEPRTVRIAAATTERESAPLWDPPPPPPPFPPLHPLIFMQRNIDEPNCTALGGLFRNQVKLVRNQKEVIRKCKRRCTVDPPPSFTPRVPMPPLRFTPRAADDDVLSASAVAASFAGHPTHEQRAAALRGCEGGGELACGFLAPSAFDAAVAAAPPHAHCRVVVLVAILILA